MGYTVNEKLLLSERLRLICDTLEVRYPVNLKSVFVLTW